MREPLSRVCPEYSNEHSVLVRHSLHAKEFEVELAEEELASEMQARYGFAASFLFEGCACFRQHMAAIALDRLVQAHHTQANEHRRTADAKAAHLFHKSGIQQKR